MAISLFVFASIFLLRDAQVLAVRDRASTALRLVVYSALQLGAIALMTDFCGTWPDIWRAWTDQRFAGAAVLIQIAEAGIACVLRRVASGRFSGVGWMLPSPVFLIALLGLSFALQDGLRLSPGSATQIAALLWLSLVSAATVFLNCLNSVSEDSKFTGDFALLTGCTALIFVPAGFF
jgi:hypothetical protein